MKSVNFKKASKEQMEGLASFIAQLVREGITFEVIDRLNSVDVAITGGY